MIKDAEGMYNEVWKLLKRFVKEKKAIVFKLF